MTFFILNQLKVQTENDYCIGTPIENRIRHEVTLLWTLIVHGVPRQHSLVN